MKLSRLDYTLAIIALRMVPVLRELGEFESSFFRCRLSKVSIEQPLFITGLARSGTTVLLDLLSQCRDVATHRYRDFPFLWFPITWNWFQDRLAKTQTAVERPHQDRIRITKESPEAFEEPIWQFFFPQIHDPQTIHILDAGTDIPDFESFFCTHIRKILLIRGGKRYLSKGNYNVARIIYLARIFSDARFIVPVREPLAHVHSLVKQHQLFTDYAAADGRITNYLKAAGHYEFGPQRQPVSISRLGTERILEAWQAGEDYRGYAVLWSEIYAHIWRLVAAGSNLADRILIIRYEDFCAEPRKTLSQILDFSCLTEHGSHLLDDLRAISAPSDDTIELPGVIKEVVRTETRFVAARFGYKA